MQGNLRAKRRALEEAMKENGWTKEMPGSELKRVRSESIAPEPTDSQPLNDEECAGLDEDGVTSISLEAPAANGHTGAGRKPGSGNEQGTMRTTLALAWRKFVDWIRMIVDKAAGLFHQQQWLTETPTPPAGTLSASQPNRTPGSCSSSANSHRKGRNSRPRSR